MWARCFTTEKMLLGQVSFMMLVMLDINGRNMFLVMLNMMVVLVVIFLLLQVPMMTSLGLRNSMQGQNESVTSYDS